jgi:hypothetical protein
MENYPTQAATGLPSIGVQELGGAIETGAVGLSATAPGNAALHGWRTVRTHSAGHCFYKRSVPPVGGCPWNGLAKSRSFFLLCVLN